MVGIMTRSTVYLPSAPQAVLDKPQFKSGIADIRSAQRRNSTACHDLRPTPA